MADGISADGATGPVIDEMQRKIAEMFGDPEPMPVSTVNSHSPEMSTFCARAGRTATASRTSMTAKVRRVTTDGIGEILRPQYATNCLRVRQAGAGFRPREEF